MVLKNVCGGHALRIARGITMLLLLMTGGAGAATPISSCGMISWPGEYVLTQNLVSNSNPCISINSSNVIFDGAGYMIIGTGLITPNLYGVYVFNPSNTLTSVTVKNLIVKNMGIGIVYDNVLYGNISNNNGSISLYDSNNVLIGNNANNDSGIYLYDSSNTLIIGNNVSSISVSGSNNRLIGNNGIGIILSGSNNMLIGNNVSNNKSGLGMNIGIILSGSNNMLIGNNVSNNYNGIYLFGSANVLSGNNVSNNVVGISLSGFSNRLIDNNVSNNYNSINLVGSSNTLISNDVSNNGYSGINLSSSSNNNTLIGNNANSNNFFSISVYGTSNTLTDNNASNNAYGISVYGSSNTLIGNNASLNRVYGISLSGSNSKLTGNNASSNTVDGVSLTGSNNTLIGNNASNNSNGISLSGSNNTLISNNASNNFLGISLSGSSNTLIGNNASNNGNHGISLSGSDYTLIGNNASLNTADGIISLSGSSYTLIGNNASNNGGLFAGIYLSGSNNALIGNNASNNGYGIYLSGFNNTLNDNNVSNNSYGIYLSGSNNALIGNNASSNNLHGISLSSSNNNTLIGNSAYSNYGFPSYGISLHSSGNNTLSGNDASNNNYSGIYMAFSSNNTLSGNNANSNYGFPSYGISLHSSSNNILSGNNASNNNYSGISLSSSSNNTLSGNNASNNNYSGISLSSSSNNTLSSNNANSNSQFSMYLYSSSNNNMLIGNNLLNNKNGFRLSSSSSNMISSNNASMNKNNGIYLSDSSNNIIYDNYFNNNNNHRLINGSGNIWNIPEISGINIIGGPNLGGNFWDYPNGTGFSQICADGDEDGICDLPYTLDGNNTDYLPLTLSSGTPVDIPTFNISGFKLNASNNNGLPGWNIRLLNATNGLEIANKTTNSSGFYNFSDIPNGIYNLTEVMKPGWVNLSAMSQIVTINGMDATNKNFTNALIPQVSTTITVLSPNGGENWTRGKTQMITWTSTGSPGTYVKIELLKAGVLKSVIIASTPNDGSHPWLIPATQTPGTDYKIRITNISNASYTDTSDNSFTIPTPNITVITPNGGETWRRGTTQTIKWNSSGSPGTYVKIELLKGGGVLNRVVIASTPNDGAHPWLIPATQAPGTDYKVRITSTTNSTFNDTSDNSFTIPVPTITVITPNGGESWIRGTTKIINWSSTESPGSYVKIELLKPGVPNRVIISSTLNDGSHPWLIPATLAPGNDYKVKITSTINASNNDTSNDNFAIPAPSFKVVSPDGGENWTRGTTKNIRWNSTESPGTYVKIELLTAGVLNRVIISSTLNDGSHPWLIPATQIPGNDYKVRITSIINTSNKDTSDDNFTIPTPSITVVTPNGGENWTRGTTRIITWNSTESPGTYVKIELLKPGKPNQLIIASTLNDGSHPWLIPAAQAPGSDYKVKITSTINASNNDTCDDNFAILAPSFKVVSPNGGENWIRGTTRIITWNSTESPGTYVKIELLKPGKPNQLIISATLNDGSHPWLIPATQIPGDYKVRITSTINVSNNDTSDNNFTIPAPSITVVSPNGGENWTQGTSKIINWSSTESPGTYVKIEILKAGVLNRVIVTSTINDGSHPWLIPVTQATGSDYRVKITSTTNLSNTDAGNNDFTIGS